MTKNDFMEIVAKKAKSSRADAEKWTSVVVRSLVSAIKKEKKFKFMNFGTFSIVTRKARNGVNPKTGKKIHVPAKKVLKFKSSNGLAEDIAKS